MNPKTFVVMAVAAVLAVSNAFPVRAQSTPDKEAFPKPRTRAEAAWLVSLPPLIESHNERLAATNEQFKRFFKTANELTTSDGLDTFVSEALGLKSKAMYVADKEGHRQFIRELFRKHVVPTEHLCQIVNLYSKELDATLADLDNKLLVKIQADVSLDPKSIQCAATDARAINREIDAVVDDVCKSVNSAVAASLAKFGVSAASGMVGEKLTRNYFADENGDVSFWNRVTAFAVGIGVDIAVDKVIEETVQPTQKLKDEMRAHARTVAHRCTQPEGPVGTQWLASLRTHSNQVLNAVTREKAVDVIWAKDALKQLGLASQWTLKP